MAGTQGIEGGLTLEDLGILEGEEALFDDHNILCLLEELTTTSCGQDLDKIRILSGQNGNSWENGKCPPVADNFVNDLTILDEEDEDYDPGFYRDLIEDEMQNKKFAKIRRSVETAISCAAKDAAQKIEQFVSTDWQFKPQKERYEYLVSLLENMGKMVFDVTEKGEVEFLAKTWERRGGTSYEDEEDEKKISLLTLNLGGEENAIFVKKTRAITKKYMYRAMKQALDQLVKDFDLNEADGMLI